MSGTSQTAFDAATQKIDAKYKELVEFAKKSDDKRNSR